MTDKNDKSPDNRARAQPHIEEVDRSATAKDASQSEQGDPAAERGERMETGKAIARGGKSSGAVPGASKPPTKKGE